jgi:hypothetical protein
MGVLTHLIDEIEGGKEEFVLCTDEKMAESL